MTFDSTLRKIVDGCSGTAAALMGTDGIPIAQVVGLQAGEMAEDEMAVLGVEFGRILDDMRKASDSVEGGAVSEVSVRLASCQVLMRSVDPETVLFLTLAPEGNAGKARFFMRRHLFELREQL